MSRHLQQEKLGSQAGELWERARALTDEEPQGIKAEPPVLIFGVEGWAVECVEMAPEGLRGGGGDYAKNMGHLPFYSCESVALYLSELYELWLGSAGFQPNHRVLVKPLFPGLKDSKMQNYFTIKQKRKRTGIPSSFLF